MNTSILDKLPPSLRYSFPNYTLISSTGGITVYERSVSDMSNGLLYSWVVYNNMFEWVHITVVKEKNKYKVSVLNDNNLCIYVSRPNIKLILVLADAFNHMPDWIEDDVDNWSLYNKLKSRLGKLV